MTSQGKETSAGEGIAISTLVERKDLYENESLLEVDLLDLNKTLLKPSHARLELLKGHNYHI